jgi:hypothetical protein
MAKRSNGLDTADRIAYLDPVSDAAGVALPTPELPYAVDFEPSERPTVAEAGLNVAGGHELKRSEAGAWDVTGSIRLENPTCDGALSSSTIKMWDELANWHSGHSDTPVLPRLVGSANSRVSPAYCPSGRGTTSDYCDYLETAAAVIPSASADRVATYVAAYNAYGGVGWNTAASLPRQSLTGPIWAKAHWSCRAAGDLSEWAHCTDDAYPEYAWPDPIAGENERNVRYPRAPLRPGTPLSPTGGYGEGLDDFPRPRWCNTPADWSGHHGDPSIAWTGNPDQVVIVQIQDCSNGTSYNSVDVVVAVINHVDTDGEPTRTYRVSDECSGNGVDGTFPMVFDPISNRVTVHWKGHAPPSTSGLLCPMYCPNTKGDTCGGVFVRTFTVDTIGNLSWVTPPQLVTYVFSGYAATSPRDGGRQLGAWA